MAPPTPTPTLTRRPAGTDDGAPRVKEPRQGAFARAVRRNLTAHAFLIGAVLCFGFFSWYPMVREVVLAFQKTENGVVSWAGWSNFVYVFNDPDFALAWRNTALFTLLALLLGFVVPFVIALVLNEFRHARGYLRLLVYLPVMLPPVASVLLFKYFYDPGHGLFNRLLELFGLPAQQWLQSSDTAMLSLVIASTWMNMGGACLIYLAALQTIPGELYEAAELDGAGLLRKIWHVTIPQTRLILSLLFLMQIIATMQVFTEPFLLTGGAGPEGSTTTVVHLIYQYAFNFNNYGAAAALGLVLLVVLAGFSAAYVRLNRAEQE
ncbi:MULTISPECIES: carbohydrate ABC transporter permease [Streptomyces]|uniref:carbohydrate ABC transporter permease n=1 Tax=Streptomyces TaxID=1883 RepID=UPI0002493E82|nr:MULTISPECIES: sugar ABC transporter permease [Streptomyces]MEE1722500.1 sugar ABC transporter permease [Streptomyces sp. JV186]NEC97040.1 sugar ABC transporter permease [Streptomyces albidoflavus]RZD84385.1 sugar ABC transporter permease [Streptomyces albidoflavus]RZD89763.1 sugar ABC transporter permease [Streptomyces albidoflavus]RZE06353.1 sugar ABC transporter permease [Streptomyces albidoflavus]